MSNSSLLAALIASSVATNGMITVGDTQPFDQVRLYQNPANNTVLTNQSTDGLVDASTTALVITGSTAPTGLVFEPNLGVLRNVTSDIKFMVDTAVDLELSVDIAGSVTNFGVEAGKTAVLTIGLIAGVPLIVGSHNFFEVAANGGGTVSGLALINATYSNNILHHTGGEIEGFNTASMLARLDFHPTKSVSVIIPNHNYTVMAILSTEQDYVQALAMASAIATLVGSAVNIGGIPNLTVSPFAQVIFGQSGDQLSLSMAGSQYLSASDPNLDGSVPVYLYLFVTDNFAGQGFAPDIQMEIINPAAAARY